MTSVLNALQQMRVERTAGVLADVENERQRQEEKFGSQLHKPDIEWMPILMEEVGEVANALLEGDGTNYRYELVQVAAVAVAAVEAFDDFDQGRSR